MLVYKGNKIKISSSDFSLRNHSIAFEQYKNKFCRLTQNNVFEQYIFVVFKITFYTWNEVLRSFNKILFWSMVLLLDKTIYVLDKYFFSVKRNHPCNDTIFIIQIWYSSEFIRCNAFGKGWNDFWYKKMTYVKDKNVSIWRNDITF